MLNNIKLKIKNSNLSKHYKKTSDSMKAKLYLPADKEWLNSVYAYNKNTLQLLPVAYKILFKSIKSYFNLDNYRLHRKARIRRQKTQFKRLSINRILISKPELKHSSDKIIITLYVYNKQKLYYLSKLMKIKKAIVYSSEGKYIVRRKKFSNRLLRKIKQKCLKVMWKVREQKKSLLKTLNKKNKFKSYEKIYLKKFFFKCLKKDILLMHHKKLISFNKSKFEKSFLSPLIKLIKNVYRKKVEFNLVNIKYLYLNSYIFSEALVKKILNKRNKLDKVLYASLKMFKVPHIDKLSTLYSTHRKVVKNLKVKYLDFNSLENDQDLETFLNKSPLDTFNDNKIHEKYMTSNIFDYLKHKYITGIRIETKGRLTRRKVAARTFYIYKTKGIMNNIDSAYKKSPSVLLRGYAKSNVQSTKLKSKVHTGSFGLKGWVSAN